MPNVLRSPFYAPVGDVKQTEWLGRPIGLNLPLASTINFPSIHVYGDITPDVAALWQRTEVRNTSLYPPSAVNPFFNEGWHLDYNVAEAFWQGRPIPLNLPTAATLTWPTEIARQWLPPDEAAPWRRTEVRSTSLYPPQPQPFFNEGWHPDYNEASNWQKQQTRNLLLTTTTPFVSEQWHYDYDVARSDWQGRPVSNSLLIASTINFPLDFRYADITPDDATIWQPYQVVNQSLRVVGTPFFSKGWHYDYNDSSSENIVFSPELSSIAQASTKLWSYDYNESSTWQWSNSVNTLINTTFGTPFFSKAWHYDHDVARAEWLGHPTGMNLVTANTLTWPTYVSKYYVQPDDSGPWKRTEVINPLYVPLGNQPFFSGAWHVDYNDASAWTGKSTSVSLSIANAITYPLASTDYATMLPDEASSWQRANFPNQLIRTTFNNAFVSTAWHVDYNDASVWTGKSTSVSLSIANTITYPASSLDYAGMLPEDTSTWYRFGYRNTLITTSFGNPFFNKGWHLDYNEASNWQRTIYSDILVRTTFPTPFLNPPRYLNYNDASVWFSKPTSVSVAMSATMLPASASTEVAEMLPDEASSWQRVNYANTVIRVTFPTPPVNPGWKVFYNDASGWTWKPPRGVVIDHPPPPVTVAGPAWRRWLAQLCGEAVLNRVPDGLLVRDIVARMLDEARCLYPDVPQNREYLLSLIPTDERFNVTVDVPVVRTPEEEEEIISRIVDDAKLRFPELFAVPELLIQDEITVVLPPAEDNSDVVVSLQEDDAEFIRRMVSSLNEHRKLVVNVPWENDDTDEDLEAILMATIH